MAKKKKSVVSRAFVKQMFADVSQKDIEHFIYRFTHQFYMDREGHIIFGNPQGSYYSNDVTNALNRILDRKRREINAAIKRILKGK